MWKNEKEKKKDWKNVKGIKTMDDKGPYTAIR